MIYEFNGLKPVIHESAFIHPQANVTGNVFIGKDVYIGPFCTIRGDFGKIIIEDGSNVQESCTIHMFPGTTTILKKNVHVGHGAIIHGGTIGENCLIGMNAVVMDGVIIGEGCIVGALCFVPAKMIIPRRKIIVGNPAKIVKDVSNEMLEWKTEGTKIYQQLARDCNKRVLKECAPLRVAEPDRPNQESAYKIWKKTE